MEAALKKPLALLCLQLAALWPVWQWYAARWRDGSDDAVGLIALLTAIALLWFRSRHATKPITPHWLWPALAMCLYAVASLWLSPLPRAALALCALLITIRCCFTPRLSLGLIGLFLLSLPLLASLQFYLGFPLRLLVARPAAAMLRAAGLLVFSEGTALRWNELLIEIDAPCSGIKMLWAGSYLVCTLAVIYRLSWQRTLAAGALGLIVILLGNLWRATALFYLEAGLIKMPAWAHSAIGVAAFVVTALLLVALVRWLNHWPGSAGSVRDLSLDNPSTDPKAHAAEAQVAYAPRTAFALACLIVALLPLIPRNTPSPIAIGFSGWPTEFEGRALTALPLTERELRFAEGFPGKLGRFHDGTRELVIRWVTRETRMLHSAADCFQGLGYRITPLPLQNDADGKRWQSFTAQRNDERLRIRERIYETNGTPTNQSWSDVSAWYWQALLGRTKGAWWAVTIAETSAH